MSIVHPRYKAGFNVGKRSGYERGLRAALEAVKHYRINPTVKTAEELAIERLLEETKGDEDE